MIPLLGLLGLAVVFVLGSAGIRVVGNAIRKRRSGSSTRNSKSRANRRKERKRKNKKKKQEKKDTKENKKNETNEVENAKDIINHFIKIVNNTKETLPEVVSLKVDTIPTGHYSIRNVEKYKNKVNSAISKSWINKVDNAVNDANNLLVALDNGENPDDVLGRLPSVPIVTLYVESGCEELIESTTEKYRIYESVEDKKEELKSRLDETNPDHKVILEEINKDTLDDMIDDIQIGKEEFQSKADEEFVRLQELSNMITEESEESYETTDKDEALEILKERKAELTNIDDKKLDELIESKLEMMEAEGKIAFDSKKSREIVEKTLKYAFKNIQKTCVSKIDEKIKNVQNSENYADELNNLPTFGADWFDTKNCDMLIEKTVKKADMYVSVTKDIEQELKDKNYSSSKDGNVKETVSIIKEIFRNLQKQITVNYIASIDSFGVELDNEVTNIKSKINSMSRDQHFSQIMSDIASLKANREDVEKKLLDLANIVETHSYDLKMLEYLDLVGLVDTVNEIKENTSNLSAEMDRKLSMLKTEVTRTIEGKISDVMKEVNNKLKAKANSATVTSKLKKLEEDLLKAIDDKLGLVDLVKLESRLETLEKAFADVENRSKGAAQEEIKKLKTGISASISRMINERISKKMKEFDEEKKAFIIEEIKKEIVAGSLENVTDRQLDDLADKVVNKIKIAKK